MGEKWREPGEGENVHTRKQGSSKLGNVRSLLLVEQRTQSAEIGQLRLSTEGRKLEKLEVSNIGKAHNF